MVRYAVGYQSRAVVTFGQPIQLEGWNPASRRDVIDLAHRVRDDVGRLYKVLPTAILAAAMRPSITRADLESRADALVTALGGVGANLAVTSGRDAIDAATELLVTRGVIVVDRGRYRVRERNVLRYYGRSIQHLLGSPRRAGRPH
jgi:hypothetical protein